MARTKSAEPEVKFNHLEKVFFPGNGFTKGDLVKYYIEIAPMLLPHFRDRPVTRIRMPDGVRGELFYEKKTTVGAYSVRGKRDEPYVSTPVDWRELKRAEKTGNTDGLFFAPADVLRRARKLGDLFAPVLKLKQRLPKEWTAKIGAAGRPRDQAPLQE